MTALRKPSRADAGTRLQTAAERFGVLQKPDLTYDAAIARETAHLYERVKAPDPGDRVAGLRALCRGHQPPEEAARRRHPRPQLPDAGDLPLRRRYRRRLAAARPRGDEGRRGDHRPVRRALHGRDVEAPEPGQDGADAGHEGRLLAVGIDHRRRRAPPEAALSRRARRHLCQHLRRGEGRERHLLHLVQCAAVVESLGSDTVLCIPDEYLAMNVAAADEEDDPDLEGPLRGARALHGRGTDGLQGGRPGDPDRRPPRMPSGRDRRQRFRRLDLGHDRLRQERASARACCS